MELVVTELGEADEETNDVVVPATNAILATFPDLGDELATSVAQASRLWFGSQATGGTPVLRNRDTGQELMSGTIPTASPTTDIPPQVETTNRNRPPLVSGNALVRRSPSSNRSSLVSSPSYIRKCRSCKTHVSSTIGRHCSRNGDIGSRDRSVRWDLASITASAKASAEKQVPRTDVLRQPKKYCKR